MFELGMGTNNIYIKSNMGLNGKPGASLRAWSNYFPKARIFGADVDPAIVGGPHDNDRIKTHWVDQTSAAAIKSLWEKFTVEFDIIIDDGLHEVSGNMSFLENSHHKLSKDGVFIIEDILPHEIPEFCMRLTSFCAKNNFEYRLLDIPKCANKIDNKIIVLARK
jgi:cyclopropane fatty-acyl-phospholipid synthase-like methyltransferase